ncbi:MAG: polyphosphate kinase 2 family protein, partial [Candidatus Binatia bacterium]
MALTPSEITKQAKRLADKYRVDKGKGFRLKHFDPGDTAGYGDDFKDEATQILQLGVERLSELQEKLYAQDHWGVLLIFQAMDAAGKDSAIKHVMSGVNPQGCHVTAFKQPSTEELDHDFLWRTTKALPARGTIGIFNRSYYEEVLVVRVHPEILEHQHLPKGRTGKRIFDERYEDIGNFERYLDRNGIVVRKFFLNVSKAEQRQRFLSRIDQPEKNWKFSIADVNEREHWNEYQDSYERMIRATASEEAPWYVIPADHKWFTRLVIAAVVVETLESLKIDFPVLDPARRA